MNKLDLQSYNGRRPYARTLSFVLQKAVSELYYDKVLLLDYDLPTGLYGEIKGMEITQESVSELKKKMMEIVTANIPIEEEEIKLTDAINIFERNGQSEKAMLAKTSGNMFMTIYKMGSTIDTFYGKMLPSTGYIKVFDIVKYFNGFCLVYPSVENADKVNEVVIQDKLNEVFNEHSHWCKILKAHGIGSLNNAINCGRAKELIQLSEALHEHKYADIADDIYEKRDKVKLILIAGPSSSGKTTTSKRIALHTKVNGMNPIVIELDNYFVNRENTPKDKNGDYNFESINALDLEFLNMQLEQLFSAEEIDVPKFDFIKGKRYFVGKKMRLRDNDVLIMEGIHALNPKLTNHISNENKYRVYASALTSLSIDENNNISTSDNRLLRRLVRDHQFRGISPESTIMRWPSVRNGEINNIFPYQENADIMFNSALIYELPMLKCYAEQLLRGVDPFSPAYPEAARLLHFLGYITALTPAEVSVIPPTSVLREFIGGSSLTY